MTAILMARMQMTFKKNIKPVSTKIKNMIAAIKIVLILFFVMDVAIGNAQFDSSKLITTSKIHVLYDKCNGILNIDSIKKDNFFQIIFLESKGFENMIFVAVGIKDLPDISIDRTNSSPFSCEYVIGYDVQKDFIYHLKGFRNNDFERFYIDHIPREYKSSSKGKLLRRETLSKFEVENIDLYCLYKAYVEKRGTLNACCVSCVERDRNYGMFR